jgi:hypothetical protein
VEVQVEGDAGAHGTLHLSAALSDRLFVGVA